MVVSADLPTSFHSGDFAIRELQHLGFSRLPPPPDLSPWIQCYWWLKHDDLPAGGYCENLYPDGGISLQLNLVENDRWGAWLGTSQRLQQMGFQGNVDSMGVRFHPGGAFWLLGVTLEDLTGDYYSAELLGLTGLNNLCESLSGVKDHYRRTAMVETWLRQQARQYQPAVGPVQLLWPRLASAPGLESLLTRAGMSRRKCERLFKQQVGVLPGHLKRLLRVKQARQLIKTHPDWPLTQVAHVCGYVDQAHFNRQFQKIAHTTPGHYRVRQKARLSAGQLTIS